VVIRALFGGSFDPVHGGHVALVQHLLDCELAHVIHVVPAWHSPHKSETTESPFHRLAMANLAFDGDSPIVVDGREISNGAPCFSYDTLTALQEKHPRDEWRLVIGADNLANFHKWHKHAELRACARIISVARAGHASTRRSLEALGLSEDEVIVAPSFSHNVSSTEIRKQLSCQSSRSSALSSLPAPVADYIEKHNLYLSALNTKDSTSR
jgi:nicotinate-nucleotide adenylyltransferase